MLKIAITTIKIIIIMKMIPSPDTLGRKSCIKIFLNAITHHASKGFAGETKFSKYQSIITKVFKVS